MKRLAVPARPGWRETAVRLGFANHTYGTSPYWTDDACYLFEQAEIEQVLRPALDALWGLCLELVDRASRDGEILASLGIPEAAWDGVRESWRRRDPAFLTRFDLAYGDGRPPKLHECNADTPGTLFEAAVFQWLWLEDQMASGALDPASDQFNRLHEALVAAFSALPPGLPVHVAASARNVEDQVWAAYVADCAREAGRRATTLDIEAIGMDAAGAAVDLENRAVRCLVKAYRWNLLLREPFAACLAGSAAPRVLEPLWKLVLASKGALVWLWRMFPGHPNLLPCWFEDDRAAPRDHCAVKPLFSIKGRNVTLRDPALPGGRLATDGPYGGTGRIVQALHYLPAFAGNGQPVRATVGGWIIDGRAEGIGVLEDDGPVVRDETSRFVPHLVLG